MGLPACWKIVLCPQLRSRGGLGPGAVSVLACVAGAEYGENGLAPHTSSGLQSVGWGVAPRSPQGLAGHASISAAPGAHSVVRMSGLKHRHKGGRRAVCRPLSGWPHRAVDVPASGLVAKRRASPAFLVRRLRARGELSAGVVNGPVAWALARLGTGLALSRGGGGGQSLSGLSCAGVPAGIRSGRRLDISSVGGRAGGRHPLVAQSPGERGPVLSLYSGAVRATLA